MHYDISFKLLLKSKDLSLQKELINFVDKITIDNNHDNICKSEAQEN